MPSPNKIVHALRRSLVGADAAAVAAERLELREDVGLVAMETADVAAERTALKEDYGAITEQAAEAAAERREIRQEMGVISDEVAARAVERQDIKQEFTAISAEAAATAAERTTPKETLFHLLKGNIGCGCLSLPWAFSQLGIPLACACCVVLAGWTYFNCITLLNIKSAHTSNRRTLTYSDLGEIAYGREFRTLLTLSIFLLQMAICTVFVGFVGENTMAFFQLIFPQYHMLGSSLALNIALSLPIIGGLTLLPNLHSLGPVSEIAMLLMFTAFAILGVVVGKNVSDRQDELPGVNWTEAPLAICAILYSFEGICIVLPLEATMKQRKKFIPIFTKAYVTVALIYCLMGGVCVWAFGKVQNGSITAFLVEEKDTYEGTALTAFANLLVCFSIIGTYPLIMFPCIELWCQAKERKDRGDTLEPVEEEDDWWGGSLAYGPYDTSMLRLTLVISTVLVALVVPGVKQMIGLAGAVAGASTALIIPPLLALHFSRVEQGHKDMAWPVVRSYFLIVVGVIIGVFGTAAAVYDIGKAILD